MAESKASASGSAKEGREYQESGSVAETIEKAKDLDAGGVSAVVQVQSTTESTPSAADESSAPGPYQGQDAPQPEDPPVRAAKPDTAVAQTLAAGAGEHTPPDPDEFDSEGRPKGEEASS